MYELPEIAAPAACDCHFHVFDAGESAAGARYVPDYSATMAQWTALAGAAGVTHGVVVQPSFLGTDNRQLLAALRRRPLTLRGVTVVAPAITADELGDMHGAGVRGVRLNLFCVGDDIGVLRALPSSYWEALLAADMHLELHADAGRIATLLPLLPRELVVVLDHFAKPERIAADDQTLCVVCRRNRLGSATYVTLSGAYRQAAGNRRRSHDLATLWREELGMERLLWGSDWPCTNFEAQADYAGLFGALPDWLPGDGRDAALTGNALRLYWR